MTLLSATLSELAAVIASVLLAVWVIVPLYPSNRFMMIPPAIAAIAIVVYSMRVRGESVRDVGVSNASFMPALRLLIIPLVVAVVVFGGISLTTNTFRWETLQWYKLITLPAWGILQQFVLQGFVYRRIRSLVENPNHAIGLTAILFSLVHLPNFPLMILTLAAGLVWTWVYSKAPNIIAIGISHGLMSLLIMSTMPKRMPVSYTHLRAHETPEHLVCRLL